MRPLIASLIVLVMVLGIYTPTESKQEPITHMVAPGETLWEIAREYYPNEMCGR